MDHKIEIKEESSCSNAMSVQVKSEEAVDLENPSGNGMISTSSDDVEHENSIKVFDCDRRNIEVEIKEERISLDEMSVKVKPEEPLGQHTPFWNDAVSYSSEDITGAKDINIHSDNRIDFKTEIKDESWWHNKTSTDTSWNSDQHFVVYKNIKETASDIEEILVDTPAEQTSKTYTELTSRNSHSAAGGKNSVAKTADDFNHPQSYIDLAETNNTNASEVKKPHICEVCKQGFVTLSNLKLHKLIHEFQSPYKCDICEKTVISLNRLERHKIKHEEPGPYKCEVCDKILSSIYNLKRHKLIHEGKGPYKCEICEKPFMCLSGLRRHSKTHQRKSRK